MTQSKKKEIMASIVDRLERRYPNAKCSLNYETPFQLLVATRLSAQCTDARVNLITPELFRRFPTPAAFAGATVEQVEQLIKSCGLYHSKAKDLVRLGQVLCERYNGQLPTTLEELITLPGIGRKTANLIMGDVYGKPAVVTDTHFIRLCNRFGMVNTTEPKKVEDAMRKLLPADRSADFCHRIVIYGREVCTARSPKCQQCDIADLCAKKIK